ncbi:MAG: LPS export ABC transporter permease LptF [Desulfobulbaceae bacterium]|nr:LPS export ABC transporter permease LptF [Desulfobulbaceae bacterium]
MREIKNLPLLLYSYIATEMLAPFFASFIILYCVFFLIRLLPLLDIVLELKIGFGDFIRLFSYIFPHLLLYVIPMASMTGVIIGFTRLTNDREILVLKASGISLKQILPPVVLLALAISLLTGFFSVSLIPAGEVAMKNLLFQLAKEKIDKGLQEKKFTETLGDLVVYVDRIDKREQWHGVYVSDMRNREQPIIIMAREGGLSAEIDKMMVTIVLNNGTMHNTDDFDNQIIRFKRYQMQIPIKPPTQIDGDDITTFGKASMNQHQLLQAAENHGSKTKKGVKFLTEFHHRLALPVGCFILCLLGIPLGLQASPGKKAIGIPLGLGVFIFYYILSTIFRVLCEELKIPVLLGMWIPNLFFLFLTFWVFRRVEKEKPIVSEWLQNKIIDFFNRFFSPVIKSFARLSGWLLRWSPGHNEDKDTVYYPDDMIIHANAEGLVYHLPGCKHYNCEHCTIKFKDAEVAQAAGFMPCSQCKKRLNSQK